ncbi:MAG: HdeD family acid-resistance protein [Paenirhodobacter sp.]|uniref:HdeD family acid-resistance protein n=1 Tax=Paenirhodobacter sp. TaxID=1965326 RepID=UPI003D0ED502
MKGTTALFVSGGLALLGGLIAILFPLPASLAVAVFVGWMFLLSGVLGLWAGFSDTTIPARGWLMLFALLQLVVGVWMLANPLKGLVSLTIVLGAIFLVSGAGRAMVALAFSGTRTFWMMLLSGVITAALGLYILFNVPESSLILLGTLLAIELVVIGSTLIALGLALKKSDM